MPDPSTPLDVSLTIACEHIAWARRRGQSYREILVSIGETAPNHPDWLYVVGRVAEAWRWLNR